MLAPLTPSAVDDAIQRKMRGRGVIVKSRTGKGITLVISNEDTNIVRIIKSLENSTVLIDGVSETVQKEIKKEDTFLGMLLETLCTSVLRNMLTGKGVIRAGEGVLRAGKVLSFLPELHSRQPRFTFHACGLFTKHYEKIQKCKKTRELNVSIKTN